VAKATNERKELAMPAIVVFQTRTCIVCGEASELELEVAKVLAWLQGAHVQVVWPEKSPADREHIKLGTHPACWTALFGDGDE
jgi:NAD(P)-dependent dehydrogenase (short-subunit alcohol dehydrogenase family)